ncbi:hypothetical protein JB92DRAFT_2931722 [Gautieria morchelliformis]|nr:hypothetical protein JB92DRAFT_2931722 [Gautieria morchelliformis]
MQQDQLERLSESLGALRAMPYRGHRAASFSAIDEAELIELRARQRTIDGAVYRTALGNLSYAVVVLKLFDQRFYRIGVLYTVLSILLFLLGYFRSRHLNHDFADSHRPSGVSPNGRVFGRAFVTAGWVVLAVSAVVAAVEVVLLALVLTV